MLMLETERLWLRQWKSSDYSAFSVMCADPAVMRFYPAVLSKQESEKLVWALTATIDEQGWGFWAVELKATAEFIGFVGLRHQELALPDAPFVEIAWRVASTHWGKGYATEAANAALAFAFNELEAEAVYAFTALINQPSRKVMSRVGMTDTQQDFDHPALAKDHPLARHCLYKITEVAWRQRYQSALL